MSNLYCLPGRAGGLPVMLVRSLRRCGLSANMMVADRTVHIRVQDAEGCIGIVKNLNDGHPAIGEAEIILTRSLKQFRLDKIEVCCGLQKLVRAAPRLSHG